MDGLKNKIAEFFEKIDYYNNGNRYIYETVTRKVQDIDDYSFILAEHFIKSLDLLNISISEDVNFLPIDKMSHIIFVCEEAISYDDNWEKPESNFKELESWLAAKNMFSELSNMHIGDCIKVPCSCHLCLQLQYYDIAGIFNTLLSDNKIYLKENNV